MATTVPLPVAINLSYWLYKIHPDVFAALLNVAKGRPSGLGSLGDDGGDFYTGITPMPDTDTTSFDVGDFVNSDAGSITTADIGSSISPDLISLPEPQLQDVSLDAVGAPTPDLQGALDDAATSSTGLDNSKSGTVGAVASVLTAGIGALGAITTAIYKANSTQAQTIQAQAARAAAGANPVPVTYGYNSAGQLVPIVANATTGTVGAISPTTLASLGIPSTWSPYILPAAIGVGLLMLLGGSKK